MKDWSMNKIATNKQGLMAGKRGLIMGVANSHSIAWGITKSVTEQGAEVALTYQNDSLGKRVKPLAEEIGCDTVLPCDVSDEDSIDQLFDALKEKWGKLDFLVHSMAFSDKDELKGLYLDTSRDNFRDSMLISCYSLTQLSQKALPLMTDGGSIVSLTFIGSRRVMPSYNVMGVAKAALEASTRYLAVDLGPQNIRVNTISAGPMRTLAGAAIGDARKVFTACADQAPMLRNATLEEVGNTGLYLCSDLSSGVTGTITHVDGGYHAMGLKLSSD
jgi:enoyl-[acyl-carrier protein] reductase I